MCRQPLKDLAAVHRRHADVRQNEIELSALDRADGLSAVAGPLDATAEPGFERVRDQLDDRLVVVHEQHPAAAELSRLTCTRGRVDRGDVIAGDNRQRQVKRRAGANR